MVLVFETSKSDYEWEIIQNQNYTDNIDMQIKQLLYSYFYSVAEIDTIYITNVYKWQKQYATCKLLKAIPIDSLHNAIAYGTHKVNELKSQKALSEIKV